MRKIKKNRGNVAQYDCTQPAHVPCKDGQGLFSCKCIVIIFVMDQEVKVKAFKY